MDVCNCEQPFSCDAVTRDLLSSLVYFFRFLVLLLGPQPLRVRLPLKSSPRFSLLCFSFCDLRKSEPSSMADPRVRAVQGAPLRSCHRPGLCTGTVSPVSGHRHALLPGVWTWVSWWDSLAEQLAQERGVCKVVAPKALVSPHCFSILAPGQVLWHYYALSNIPNHPSSSSLHYERHSRWITTLRVFL